MIGSDSQEDWLVLRPLLTLSQIGAQDGAVLDVAEEFNVYAMDLTLA